MGKIEKNAVMNGFSGAIGENLVLRQVGKQTFFSRRTKVKNPKSVHQKANRNRFAEATLFAVSEFKKPDGASYRSSCPGLPIAQLTATSKPQAQLMLIILPYCLCSPGLYRNNITSAGRIIRIVPGFRHNSS